MKKAIIFDMDGTLWDSVDQIVIAWNMALEKMGISSVEVTRESLEKLMGQTMDKYALAFFPDLPFEEAMEHIHVMEEEENKYLAQNGARLLGDISGVWNTLRGMGFEIGIVSNCQSGYIEAFLEHYGWKDLVDDTECYGDTLMEKADNIRLVVKRNGYEMAFYVGDTKGDQDASKGAGVPFIYAAYGFGEAEEPVPRIESLDALPNCMANILLL